MKRTPLILSVFFALALLTACAGPAARPTAAPQVAPPTAAPQLPAATAAPTMAATEPATAAVPVTGGQATVALGTSSLGSILVDAKGMSLYTFAKDTPNTSNCYGQCATNWPALLTSGNPAAGQGLDASKLGTTQRTDGTTQVTYNGQPLYYFIGDKQPGDTNGQGIGGVWYVATAEGSQPQQPTQPAQPQPTQSVPKY